ncbi:MAG: aminopeptidase P family protein [Firmicutes bacterium]|nr:aminopeptidase P family protein [Bacillota bacterium]
MERYKKLQNLMADVDGMMVMQAENRRWLTGFTGSAGIAVVPRSGKPVFMTDFRYVEQATEQVPGFEIVQAGREMLSTDLQQVLTKLGIRKLGFEKDHLTVGQFQKMETALSDIQLVAQDNVVLELRSEKDGSEIELLAEAVRIADEAFNYILDVLKPGLTERAVALELEHYMQAQGAAGASFEIIVASGPRSALPHGVASEKVLRAGEFVKMDFGCVYQGYCSDITRTVVLGKADERQREIYHTVLDAQLAAIDGIRPGLTGADADALARNLISERGYGDNFGHGLGHGVGLAVHELPTLSPASTHTLQVNNAVTVEPGIYLPGWGGVRIEDIVVVTETGCRILTSAPKNLIELA